MTLHRFVFCLLGTLVLVVIMLSSIVVVVVNEALEVGHLEDTLVVVQCCSENSLIWELQFLSGLH